MFEDCIPNTILVHAKYQTDGKNIKLWYFNAQKITLGILDLYLLYIAIQGKVFMIKFSRAPSAIQVPDPEVNVVSREDLFHGLQELNINIHSEPLSVSLWYNPCCSTILHNLVTMLLGWVISSLCKTCDVYILYV